MCGPVWSVSRFELRELNSHLSSQPKKNILPNFAINTIKHIYLTDTSDTMMDKRVAI